MAEYHGEDDQKHGLAQFSLIEGFFNPRMNKGNNLSHQLD